MYYYLITWFLYLTPFVARQNLDLWNTVAIVSWYWVQTTGLLLWLIVLSKHWAQKLLTAISPWGSLLFLGRSKLLILQAKFSSSAFPRKLDCQHLNLELAWMFIISFCLLYLEIKCNQFICSLLLLIDNIFFLTFTRLFLSPNTLIF